MALCSMQERCVSEIEKKLISWGITSDDIKEIIKKLNQNDFINEVRYTRAFVKDKFGLNKWGKQKILFTLRQKNISNLNIQKAFDEIPDENYLDVIQSELIKKYEI